MVAVPAGRGRSIPARLKPLAHLALVQPVISSWRLDPIKLRVEFRANDKLSLSKFHPHKDCSGHFMLHACQIRPLVDGWRSGRDAVRLPQMGRSRCEAWHLPDHGMQLLRFDKRGDRTETLRILAADVGPFLRFCEDELYPLL